jgi:glycosyltransferase involved in cell wall biosynthesis
MKLSLGTLCNLRDSKVIYIGETKGIHDLRFLRAIGERFQLDSFFLSENGDLEKIDYSQYDLIVAAPLTRPISVIPSSTQIPIVGISLAYDLNFESDNAALSANLQECSFIICDCQYICDKVINEYGINQKRVGVIAYGCDLELFAAKSPKTFNEPSLLVTRNWFPTHSNRIVLDALQRLHSQGMDIKCTFVGDGPELQESKRELIKNSINSNISFLGSKSPIEVAHLMETHEIYISASQSDGSSVSLMEALASGMICVVSNFPSNLEWIKDRYSGFLFQNGSEESLANTLKEVLALDPQTLAKIGERARKIAAEKANWGKNKMEFLKFLESVIE